MGLASARHAPPHSHDLAPGQALRLRAITVDASSRVTAATDGLRGTFVERDTGSQEGPGAAPGADHNTHPSVLGMTFGSTDDVALHNRLGLPADIKGAAVLSVKGSSDAKEKGLQAGDVVVRAGDRSVREPGDIPAAVADARHAGRSSILLGVWRDGRTTFVAVKLEG